MSFELIPYLLLLISIVVGWQLESRSSLVLLCAAIAAGLATGRLIPESLFWVGMLGLSLWLPTNLSLKTPQKILCFSLFAMLALAMFLHIVPGFNNLIIFQEIEFSPDSVPFTMHLNFDKTLVGLFILLFIVKPQEAKPLSREHMLVTGKLLLGLITLFIPIALATQYIRVDLKLPELSWIWLLNNLFFVCLAEEAFFRCIIQKGLIHTLPKTKTGTIASIFIASALFGLAHFRGGLGYVVLATIAGLFYGYAYQRTHRLESAILIHFGLNTTHFLLFSYPALITHTS